MKRIDLRFLGVALLLCAAAPAASAQEMVEEVPVIVSRPAGDAEATEEATAEAPAEGLRIGVVFADPGSGRRARKIASAIAETGLTAARIGPDAAVWGRMQPRLDRPIGFGALDDNVRTAQAAGFSELTLCLSPSLGPDATGERLDACAAWVAAVVERYDADGIDDMPDLRTAVARYEIGAELPGEEALDGYLDLLSRAYAAAHEAYPDVVITHAGFPSPSGSSVLLERLLDRSELFDAVNLYALGSPDQLAETARSAREAMAARAVDRPIVVGVAATTPFLRGGHAEAGEGEVIPPATEADRRRLADYFTRLVKKDEAALGWARRYAASDLVKKITVAAAADIDLIHAARTQDLEDYTSRRAGARAGNAAWAGLVDGRARSRHPAFFALDQAAIFLDGAGQVERLPAMHDRVHIYAVHGGAGERWIAWAEPEGLLLPGDEVPIMEIDLPVAASHVIVERLTYNAQPSRMPVPIARGAATVKLTPYPTFLFTQYLD